jgi:hypothetical protein
VKATGGQYAFYQNDCPLNKFVECLAPADFFYFLKRQFEDFDLVPFVRSACSSPVGLARDYSLPDIRMTDRVSIGCYLEHRGWQGWI